MRTVTGKRSAEYAPSDHDVAGEELRHTGAPVPEDPELGTVALEEAQGGAHEVSQLHPPGPVLHGRGLLAGEEEPLKDWRGRVKVPGSKPAKEESEGEDGKRQEVVRRVVGY